MSIKAVLYVTGGISIGVGIGTQWARTEIDRFYRKKGEEFVSEQYRAMTRAFEARTIEAAEAPVADEIDLMDQDVKIGGQAELIELVIPDYVTQASEYASDVMLTGISYIDEDDYNEEDGNAKEQITIYLGAGNEEPTFLHDGIPVSNWQELIGETILVDFYRKIPVSVFPRVLYVRNHTRGEDFEVFQEIG